jgi:hypothetical protein
MHTKLKAFIDGWGSKGKHPSVPPAIARPYTDSVLSYLEDFSRRDILRNTTCISNDDIPSFSFSYNLIPFILADLCARGQFAHHSASYDYVKTVLLDTLSVLYDKKPPVRLGAVIINPLEIDNAKEVIRLTRKEVLNRNIILNTELNLILIAKFYFASRSTSVSNVFVRQCKEHGDVPRALAKCLSFASQDFVHGSTNSPTQLSFEAAAVHVHDTYNRIHDAIGYE